MLNAYDTMRGAGISVEKLTHFAVPAGVTVDEINDTLNAIRRESLSTWNYQQKQYLESVLEGAERIVSADSPLRALQRHRELYLQSHQVQARHRRLRIC